MRSLDRIIDHMADKIANLLEPPPRTPSPPRPTGPMPYHPPAPPPSPARRLRRHYGPAKPDKPPPLRPRPRSPSGFGYGSHRRPSRRRRKTVRWGTITVIPHVFRRYRSRERATYRRYSSDDDAMDIDFGAYNWSRAYGVKKLKSILKPPTALDVEMMYRNLWEMNMQYQRQLEHTYEFLNGVLAVSDEVLDGLLRAGEFLMMEEAKMRAAAAGARRARPRRRVWGSPSRRTQRSF